MRRLVHRKKNRHPKESRAQPLLTLTKGDTVEIITGNDKGKRGRILRVYPRTGRVMVEGVNVVKRHTKPTQTSEGGIVEKVMPIHHSNAMLIDPKTGEPTRIRRQRDKEGSVERIAVKSGQPIPRTR